MIMAAYNAAPFLEQSLGSLLDQTYTDFEILCVDDGSTDDTVSTIEHVASTRPNGDKIRLLRTDHVGAGIARNIALQQAQGEYIGFLDADDFVDKQLLEKAVYKADTVQADIVIWDLWFYDHNTQIDQYPPVGTLTFSNFDDGDGVFTYTKNPDYIFNSFQNWIWNKLFRRSFLIEHKIKFPDFARTQDLQFTCLALVEAQRIAVIYERLSHYRINRGSSNMDTNDQHPLNFLDAFIALKAELMQRGMYKIVQRSYVNWALQSALANMFLQRRYSTFREVFNALKEHGFDQMDITGHATQKYIQCDIWLTEYHMILEESPEDVLMYFTQNLRTNEARGITEINRLDRVLKQREDQIRQLSDTLETQRNDIATLRMLLHNITISTEYRFGKNALLLPRLIKNLVVHRQ